MLKKTSASIGLVIAAAAGAPLTSSPAYAHANLIRGWHSHHHHHHKSHNRNWNANQNRARIFIRVYVINRNTNKAVAVAARPARRLEPVVVRDADPVVRDIDPVVGLNGGAAAPTP
ncbi:MAG: hypothetical protein JWR24_3460 [Actinoallomurus sp.]|nr:hypothetical protein [Actinoallomurus sp.]